MPSINMGPVDYLGLVSLLQRSSNYIEQNDFIFVAKIPGENGLCLSSFSSLSFSLV